TKAANESFIFINENKTWSDAQAYCRQYHTDLASARTVAESSAIKSLTYGFIWIGLFRDSWKWIDKSNFSTISWMPGTPYNLLGHENCGYFYNGQAGDAQCTDIMPFFCYR
ncbi:putative C-type lectin domain family 20 member A isoform X1, partial [Clarias magur]